MRHHCQSCTSSPGQWPDGLAALHLTLTFKVIRYNTHEDKASMKLEDPSVFVVADVVIIIMIADAVVARAVLVVAS